MLVPLGAIQGILGGNLQTPAKSRVGKFLGNLTGRNANVALAQSQNQTNMRNPQTQLPLSGGFQFGAGEGRKNWQPIAIAGIILVALLGYFGKSKRRRR